MIVLRTTIIVTLLTKTTGQVRDHDCLTCPVVFERNIVFLWKTMVRSFESNHDCASFALRIQTTVAQQLLLLFEYVKQQ